MISLMLSWVSYVVFTVFLKADQVFMSANIFHWQLRTQQQWAWFKISKSINNVSKITDICISVELVGRSTSNLMKKRKDTNEK